MILLTTGPPETGGGCISGQRRQLRNRATCLVRRVAVGVAAAIRLTTEKRQEQAYENAEDDAADDRKIKRGVSALDADIPRQPPQPSAPEPAPEREAAVELAPPKLWSTARKS